MYVCDLVMHCGIDTAVTASSSRRRGPVYKQMLMGNVASTMFNILQCISLVMPNAVICTTAAAAVQMQQNSSAFRRERYAKLYSSI
jgi:hypothetical protein